MQLVHQRSINVDPVSHRMMVLTAVRVPATGERAEAVALWPAPVVRYGR